MTSRHIPIRRLAGLLAALVTLAALLTTAVAFAGGVQFRDTAELFTPQDRESIVANAKKLPFDVRVLTTTQYHGEQFDSYVRSQISGSDQVIVGLNPEQHRVAVFCGAATRIESGACKASGDAGKQFFRNKQWAPGIEAVLVSANDAAGARGTTTAPASTPARRSGGSMFGIMLLGAVGLIAIVAILSAVFRKRQPPIVNQTTSQGPPIGGFYGQQPPPQGVQPYPYQGGGGMGGIGSHLGAAALGGLAGYGLGRAMSGGDHQHEGYDRSDMGAGQADDFNRVGGGGSDWGGDSNDADVGGGSDDWGGGGGDGGGSDW